MGPGTALVFFLALVFFVLLGEGLVDKVLTIEGTESERGDVHKIRAANIDVQSGPLQRKGTCTTNLSRAELSCLRCNQLVACSSLSLFRLGLWNIIPGFEKTAVRLGDIHDT